MTERRQAEDSRVLNVLFPYLDSGYGAVLTLEILSNCNF